MNEGLSLSIRIRHPSMAPELVSARLGVDATSSRAAGSPKRTPSGKLLGGSYAETYWVYRLLDRDDANLEKAIDFASAWLTTRSEHLNAIVSSGGSAELYVSVSSPSTFAVELHADLLAKCASLCVGISLEVFRK